MVRIKILSGYNSIGGNFIRIEDDDRTLIFDQGIRFDAMARYYSWLISPIGLAELRELGVLPKAEWYRDADAVYITHMHLDHLGALSNIPSEISVHLPSLTSYMDIEEKWKNSPTWLSLIPRRYYIELKELKPLKTDENEVTAIPVSHSAHPSYALLYYGSDQTILYTGDFRVESFLNKEEFEKLREGEDLLTYIGENPDIKVDTLIIEGTNIGADRTPLLPRDALEIIKRIVFTYRPIIATLHMLDLEYAYALLKLAEELGLECLLISPWMVKMIEKIPKPETELKVIEEYIDFPTLLEKTSIEDIEKESIILTPHRGAVDFLRDLKRRGVIEENPVAILSEPELEREEPMEYDIVANWFSRLGVQHYRIRVSGHYYPYQLKEIIQTIKPKKIEPIHTLKPELMYIISKTI